MRALLDSLALAFRSLRAAKLRSALTLLGIVIGVATVVGAMSVTEGLRRRIDADLSELGSNVFQIQKQIPGFLGGDRAKWEKRKNLTLADVDVLRERCHLCVRVGGELWQFGVELKSGARQTQPSLAFVGGTAEFFDNNGYEVGAGRFFDEAEVASADKVIVLGADVADVLFPGEPAVGSWVRARGVPYRVVGVLARQGQSLEGWSKDTLAVVPLPAFLESFGEKRSLNVTVQAIDAAHLDATVDEARAILRAKRGVAPYEEDDFSIFTNQSILATFGRIAGTIAAATTGICLLSLLVGGIGVMNIMLVSVTERTSEIGVRRALGARRRRILAQFLLESVILAALGGVAGLALGGLVAALVRALTPMPATVPAWAAALSLACAAFVGLVFGTYPALRASRLDPVEAMRAE